MVNVEPLDAEHVCDGHDVTPRYDGHADSSVPSGNGGTLALFRSGHVLAGLLQHDAWDCVRRELPEDPRDTIVTRLVSTTDEELRLRCGCERLA